MEHTFESVCGIDSADDEYISPELSLKGGIVDAYDVRDSRRHREGELR